MFKKYSKLEKQLQEAHKALKVEANKDTEAGRDARWHQERIEKAYAELFGKPFQQRDKDNKMTTQEMIQTIRQLQQDAKANAAKLDNLLIRLGQQQK